jgi:hypothetical protein
MNLKDTTIKLFDHTDRLIRAEVNGWTVTVIYISPNYIELILSPEGFLWFFSLAWRFGNFGFTFWGNE